MTLAVVLALVICFTNFVQLHACKETGEKVAGTLYVAYDAIQAMRNVPEHHGCTQLSFQGGAQRFVQETPEEIIRLQEQRNDDDFGGKR